MKTFRNILVYPVLLYSYCGKSACCCFFSLDLIMELTMANRTLVEGPDDGLKSVSVFGLLILSQQWEECALDACSSQQT